MPVSCFSFNTYVLTFFFVICDVKDFYSSYVYIDSNNWNKNLIRKEMLQVNRSFGRFWSNTAHLERKISSWTRGVVYAEHYSNRCPCSHLFWSSLPGCNKMILSVHVCSTFSRQGSSWGIPFCFPVSCIAAPVTLDICIITMSNVGQRQLPAFAAKESAPVYSYLDLSSYFWASENGEIMYKCL